MHVLIWTHYWPPEIGASSGPTKMLSFDCAHRSELDAFSQAIRVGRPPVAIGDDRATTAASFGILESLRSRAVVHLSRTAGLGSGS